MTDLLVFLTEFLRTALLLGSLIALYLGVLWWVGRNDDRG